ncbi:MAG: DUF5666 domain-containing protein [Terriglobia bacterium]
MVLFGASLPVGNVLACELTLSSATLIDSAGNAVTLLSAPVELEWRGRALAPTVLSIASVPPATYTELIVTLATPEITVFDPLTSTFAEISPPLSVASVTLPTEFTVTTKEVAGVRLELDLRHSIQLDSSNNFLVTPHFSTVPTPRAGGKLPGAVDHVLGTVVSLDADNTQFLFATRTSQQPFIVLVDSATRFDGVARLGNLGGGDVVALNARLQIGGAFLARAIEWKASASNRLLRGLVLARTPATGSLNSLTLLVLDRIPEEWARIGDIITVGVDSATEFHLRADSVLGTPIEVPGFNQNSLRAGQSLTVVERAGGAGLRADSVTLDEITLAGRAEAVEGASSFDLRPEGAFFSLNGLGRVRVLTSPATEWEDLPAGAGSLTSGTGILGVRGVLGFRGGTGTLIALRVRRLP